MIKFDNKDKDKKDWEEFIRDPKNIFDKESKETTKAFKNTFRFDLHGYTLENANKKVKEIVI